MHALRVWFTYYWILNDKHAKRFKFCDSLSEYAFIRLAILYEYIFSM